MSVKPEPSEPHLKMRLFPPNFDARGKEALDTLRQPLVFIPTVMAMVFLTVFMVLFGYHRALGAWVYFFN